MENSLVIGNGLNRTINDIAWGNLLEDIASEFGVEYNSRISMPLEFERIVNSKMAKDYELSLAKGTIKKAKEMVAQKTKVYSLPAKAIHHRIKSIKAQNILTTNYDFMIETALESSYKYDGPVLNKYYFQKTAQLTGCNIFHVHGLCENSNSLCLGYEHYMGIVEHLRSDINTQKDNKQYQMAIRRILDNEDLCKNTWGEKFYTSNIAIVGLELSEAESDLWWLLTHRAYLYYSDYYGLRHRNILNNRIVYYDVLDLVKKETEVEESYRKHKAEEKRLRHKLLFSENVEVRTYEIGPKYESYEEAYHSILDDITTEYGRI